MAAVSFVRADHGKFRLRDSCARFGSIERTGDHSGTLEQFERTSAAKAKAAGGWAAAFRSRGGLGAEVNDRDHPCNAHPVGGFKPCGSAPHPDRMTDEPSSMTGVR